MSFTSNVSSKRRRVSVKDLNDLPDALLKNVALFLPNPSRAMLAVAMTAPSSSWCEPQNGIQLHRQPSAASKAIISCLDSEEVLDLGGIEKSMASRLTDNDIAAVLLCIDAINKIKTLKLAGCLNITGQGLNPLRGSMVLRQIDLSLAKQHEKPYINPKPAICAATVVPILDSIIGREGNSLAQIQFPMKWREAEGNAIFSQFFGRYGQLLNGRRIGCSVQNCTDICDGNNEQNGFWEFTCYQCLKVFCNDCYDCCHLQFAECCQKKFCEDCVNNIFTCENRGCAKQYCAGCDPGGKRCDSCEEEVCSHCIKHCDYCDVEYCSVCDSNVDICENYSCNKMNCRRCARDDEDTVHDCSECRGTWCTECLVDKFKGADTALIIKLTMECHTCAKVVTSALAKEKEAKKQNE